MRTMGRAVWRSASVRPWTRAGARARHGYDSERDTATRAAWAAASPPPSGHGRTLASSTSMLAASSTSMLAASCTSMLAASSPSAFRRSSSSASTASSSAPSSWTWSPPSASPSSLSSSSVASALSSSSATSTSTSSLASTPSSASPSPPTLAKASDAAGTGTLPEEARARVRALLQDRERVVVLNNVLRSARRDDVRRFLAANLTHRDPAAHELLYAPKDNNGVMTRWLVQFPERESAYAALPFLNGARLGTNIVYAQKTTPPRSVPRNQLYRSDLRAVDDLAAFNAFPGRTVLLSSLGRARLTNDLQTVLRVYRLEGSCQPYYVLPKSRPVFGILRTTDVLVFFYSDVEARRFVRERHNTPVLLHASDRLHAGLVP